MYRILDSKLKIQELLDLVASPEAGAVSTFSGVTRNHTGDLSVIYLEYEAYESMALKLMRQIGDEAREKFPIEKIAIFHRIGRVDIGEPSIIIAVSGGHRRESIEACHYAINRLKAVVPIWKKEYFEESRYEWIVNSEATE